MTDKEQKKWHEQKWGTNEEPKETPTERPHCDDDSIKNQDKEQIIIDGVDVSGCILRRRKEPNCTVCNGYSSKVFEFDCSDFKNCYFKQLARKTQECEELKEQLMETKTFDLFADKLIEKFNTDSAIASIFKDNIRYRKAIEEIESDIKILGNRIPLFETKQIANDIKKILDIINKAKDDNND